MLYLSDEFLNKVNQIDRKENLQIKHTKMPARHSDELTFTALVPYMYVNLSHLSSKMVTT